MAKRYKVTLTDEERIMLTKLTKDGKTDSKKFIYVRALFLFDASEGKPTWRVADVAEALGISTRTIENLKRRFVEENFTILLFCY